VDGGFGLGVSPGAGDPGGIGVGLVVVVGADNPGVPGVGAVCTATEGSPADPGAAPDVPDDTPPGAAELPDGGAVLRAPAPPGAAEDAPGAAGAASDGGPAVGRAGARALGGDDRNALWPSRYPVPTAPANSPATMSSSSTTRPGLTARSPIGPRVRGNLAAAPAEEPTRSGVTSRRNDPRGASTAPPRAPAGPQVSERV